MSQIWTWSLSSALRIPLPILCITRTKLLPGSRRTRLKIRGRLMPTAATPYVAIIILPVAVATSSYSSCLAFALVAPLTNTASSPIRFSSSVPALILSTNTNVLPVLFTSITKPAMVSNRPFSSNRYFNSL